MIHHNTCVCIFFSFFLFRFYPSVLSRQTCKGLTYRPNYMTIMRGQKHAKRRTGKRTPHHRNIFVVRYHHATHTISGTDRKRTSRSDRVIGFARCHSSAEPFLFSFLLFSFFIYPRPSIPQRDAEPGFPSSIVHQQLHSSSLRGGDGTTNSSVPLNRRLTGHFVLSRLALHYLSLLQAN